MLKCWWYRETRQSEEKLGSTKDEDRETLEEREFARMEMKSCTLLEDCIRSSGRGSGDAHWGGSGFCRVQDNSATSRKRRSGAKTRVSLGEEEKSQSLVATPWPAACLRGRRAEGASSGARQQKRSPAKPKTVWVLEKESGTSVGWWTPLVGILTRPS
ncbi:hypothetical protein K490DRAFT_55152 [Saccharata proteae CBS 121410]|uniref:Uncharacterized protein n=1 Tax=Saccharata proteae CBS 121410 TaxID=1314787 RepID=A0A6A5YCZ5_9PEZI|nr:hypothetical protein K490DRAFT_55152 [Saccharata proteae CBS 121410]